MKILTNLLKVKSICSFALIGTICYLAIKGTISSEIFVPIVSVCVTTLFYRKKEKGEEN